MYYFTICKVHKKSIEKIISQNVLVDTKLEKLLAEQKRLEQRIMNLEKSVNNKNNTSVDSEYLKIINILVIVCIRRKLTRTYISII